MIAKKDLKHGAYYAGHCRNATEARWDAVRQVFVHWREKFRRTFTEDIYHPEDEQRFDVFIPERELAQPQKAIPLPTDDLPDTEGGSCD